MYIARILYPVEVLGPGKRIGIWLSGCQRKCNGCSNPELWEQKESEMISIPNIMTLITKISSQFEIDGFTITGGEPFLQAEELLELVPRLKTISDDILVYTGFLKEELSVDFLKDISVLIDGKYIEELNHGSVLKGSDNQRIFVLDSSKEDLYNSYFLNATNKIQNFQTTDGIVSVGIHKPGFKF